MYNLAYSVSLYVPAHISENFPDTKIIIDFYLSHCIELNNTKIF